MFIIRVISVIDSRFCDKAYKTIYLAGDEEKKKIGRIGMIATPTNSWTTILCKILS